MHVDRLYEMVKLLEESEKKEWKNKILSSLHIEIEDILNIPLEVLVLAVYSCFDNNYDLPNLKVIAYGAGKMAQKYIPSISKIIDFYEIWDAYSDIKNINTIQVVRPEVKIRDLDIPLIIFIDDRVTRYEVISFYRKKGYHNIFYFRDYITILKYHYVFKELKHDMTDTARSIADKLYLKYEIIQTSGFPVLFSILKRDLKNEKIKINNRSLCKERLIERLQAVITFDRIAKEIAERIIDDFLHTTLENIFELAYSLEIVLQSLLSNGVKTLERPMKMADDNPYDEFAVTATINEILIYLFEDLDSILEIIRALRKIAEESIPLIASECYFLIKEKKYKKALELARNAMKKGPNDLLANEVFYQVALECKNEGIYVDEPIPEYDLSERFCWSGLNFVWCGGFDSQTNMPEFSPCFRPLQCAARPEGKFWNSDDWKEFRRSVTDGSFRYCQKNQCANIVGGWLPKKADCKDEWLRKILDGDMSVVPPIEELHFSYDGHCNLKCPSCRLEIQTNTREQNEKLDRLYEENLKPYMAQAKHLTLSGCGEAMISPHSKKVLQSFSKEKNPKLVVELRTNATTINPISWNSLGSGKDVIRHITVSIDGSTKETFEKLRFPARWEIVLQNLKFIQTLRNSGEIDMFEFHVVIQEENVTQLCDIAKMAIYYDADAVTYSRLINWRGMSEEEYHAVNPFWYDHHSHARLLQELKALEKLRGDIEENKCNLTCGRKKIYINIHFIPDPNSSYDEIRMGRLKIR